MIVYPDTSFLVSFLNEDDANHALARGRAAKFKEQDFVVCELHQLELPAAVRAAAHRQTDALPIHIARRIINRFDRAVNGRLFLRKSVDLTNSVAMTRSLGDTHGWNKRHTTFDLWHLAAVARLIGMST